ncbi:MAG TPA: hypothetical protein VGP93_14020, partial [Polyangiaceae bacterium]|nr:hypothetical protein [Polyangiaceae bacterium]
MIRKDFGSLLFGFLLLGCSATDFPARSTNEGGSGGSGGKAQGGGGTQSAGGKSGTGGSVAGGSGGSSAGGVTSGGASNGGATSGGSSSGGGTAGPAAARFIGRWNSMNQSAWSGSAIELRFTGTDLSVTMSGTNTWYEINVDGTLSKQQIGGTAQLATGLANGEHFVQMVRRAEAQTGTSQFVSFSVPESAVLAQQVPTRRLEVIGDSLAVAYGYESDCSDKVNAGENAYMSWGWLAARALSADVHIIGWSGAGMATSMYSDKMIPQYYDKTLGWNSTETWDFS